MSGSIQAQHLIFLSLRYDKAKKDCKEPVTVMDMGDNGTNDSFIDSEREPQFQTSEHLPYVILTIFIVLMNTFVILLFAFNKNLRKPSNYLLVSLSVSDMLFGLLGLPLVLVCSTTPICAACVFSFSFIVFTSISTVLHILVISYERYLKIVFPFRMQQIGRACFELKLVAILWLISLSVPPIQFIWLPPNESSCLDELTPEEAEKETVYTFLTMGLFVGLPLLLLIYADVSVFFVVRRQLEEIEKTSVGLRESQKRLQKETRVLALFAFMMVYFVIAWSVYYASTVVHSFLKEELYFPDWLVRTTEVLRCSTPLVNPLLYVLLKHDFRRVVFHGITRLGNKYLGTRRQSSAQGSGNSCGVRTIGGQTDSRNFTERTVFL